MRKALTATFAAAAAIPLAFLAAAPASAAAGDITAVFTTTPNPGGSNTVTGTFTATGINLPTFCVMVDATGSDEQTNPLLEAGASGTTSSVTVTDTDVPDGTYTIQWFCLLSDGVGYDGTADYLGEASYSPSTMLIVPAVVPEVPEPACTGSVCLPAGSAFGI